VLREKAALIRNSCDELNGLVFVPNRDELNESVILKTPVDRNPPDFRISKLSSKPGEFVRGEVHDTTVESEIDCD
jgi:hypothetical protein